MHSLHRTKLELAQIKTLKYVKHGHQLPQYQLLSSTTAPHWALFPDVVDMASESLLIPGRTQRPILLSVVPCLLRHQLQITYSVTVQGPASNLKNLPTSVCNWHIQFPKNEGKLIFFLGMIRDWPYPGASNMLDKNQCLVCICLSYTQNCIPFRKEFSPIKAAQICSMWHS